MRLLHVLGSLLFVTSIAAQGLFGPVGATLQDSVELAAMIGSEEETGAILADVSTSYLRVNSKAQTVVVPASQLREEWLPQSAQVRFIRVTDQELRELLVGCGSYVSINAARRSDDLVITVGRRNRCRSSGLVLEFRRESGSWQRDIGRLAGGFRSSTGHCGCSLP
jgi:hypothetical protein